MRKYLLTVAVAAAVLAGPFGAAAQDTLVISTWGFNGDKLREIIYEPFEKLHGVKIVVETGNNSDRLNKVRLRQGSAVDVIYLASSFSAQGIEAGLFAEINRANIPNLSEIYDLAEAPHGDAYGPAYTVGRFGIVYDTAAVSAPIESWSDLWRDDLKRNISVPGITTTSGPMMVLIAAEKAGKLGDTDAAFAELRVLKPNLVKTYGRSSELVNLFAQGEVVAGAVLDFAFGRIKDAVPTARWVDPSEGAYANLNTINIVKGSPRQALAEKYINFVLGADIQQSLAIARVDSPVNVNVTLSSEQANGLTYGTDLIAELQSVDWAAVNRDRPQWIDLWNANVSAN